MTQKTETQLEAVPKWRLYTYLTIYFGILAGTLSWNQLQNPEFPIWKAFLIFSIFFSIPPAFFIWVNKFTNKEYALKHGPAVFRLWYIVMGIQILLLVLKLVTSK